MILQCRAAVTDAPNQALVGLNGTIVDETKHMIVLETAGGPRMIPKSGVTLHVGELHIPGEELRGRLYERLTGP